MSLALCVNNYLLWCTQDLANLEYGVYFTGSWEKRPEGIQLCHNAANCPLVYRWTVGCGSEEHLWSSVPGTKRRVRGLRHPSSTWELRLLKKNKKNKKINSPSSWNIIRVRRSRSDLSGKPKVSYFHQLWAHAQKILWLHIPVEKT